MSTSAMNTPSTPAPRSDAVPGRSTETSDRAWRPLYAIGGAAALLAVLILIQGVYVYLLWPPPSTIENWFSLFQRNGFLGLLSLDLLLAVGYVVLIPLYLALYAVLRRANQSLMAIALAFNLAGAALIIAVNPALAMFTLSGRYAAATSALQRTELLAAGQAILANRWGTALIVGYVLGGIAMLITATVILRSDIFSKLAAYAAYVAGVLMFVPVSAGTVGLIVSFVALVPMVFFLALVARKLFQMSQVPVLGGSPYRVAHPR